MRRCSGLLVMMAATLPAGTVLADPPRVTRLVSPDGRRVAFGLTAVDAQGSPTRRIVVAGSDGSGRHGVEVDPGGPVDVIWFGDDRLAYAPARDPLVYEVIALDGRPVETLRLPESCRPREKCLSPDGKLVVYRGGLAAEGKARGVGGLFVVDPAAGKVRRVSEETVMSLPAWSPDSRRIAFGAGAYVKDFALKVVDVASGEAEPVGFRGSEWPGRPVAGRWPSPPRSSEEGAGARASRSTANSASGIWDARH